MTIFSWIRLALLLVAALSPLLTFAALWQMKEWRIDRLLEHFRAEGFWRQVKGKLRPAIILIGAIATYFSPVTVLAADATLIALALVSVAQIALRRQRYPVWTMKTLILLAVALAVDTLASALLLKMFFATAGLALSVLVLFQADALSIAWLLFWPIDTLAKKRVMKRAKKLRSTYENAIAIGITGSVGKTTTKELIAHILAGKHTLCTPAYVNSEMGVANWLLSNLPKHKSTDELILIVEMGAYRSGEIRTLCDIAKPSIGIITYIGSQHIALFGSQQKLCDAKAEIIQDLPTDGTALLNADNKHCEYLTGKTHASVVTVGTGGHADIEAFDIEETGNGIRFRIGDMKFSVPIHGTHNVTNVLLAVAAARTIGMSDKDIAKRLSSFSPPSKTFMVREDRGVTILDDTHNASPESFRAAIEWSKSQPMTKKVLLTPGLIELGTEEARIHEELGTQAQGVFDRVIFTANRTREMFGKGYGETELYKAGINKLTQGDLLVCVGRVPQSAITSLLP